MHLQQMIVGFLLLSHLFSNILPKVDKILKNNAIQFNSTATHSLRGPRVESTHL